jgi:LSD1 subclass zinc finger protein
VVPTGDGSTPNRPEDGSPAEEPLNYNRGAGLIYCGLCGALNPASNHYCARCGSTLVDAFHATEGLRVFQKPDDASRIVEIVTSGSALEVLPDDDAPADYTRIRLEDGRLGYVKFTDLNVPKPGAMPTTASVTQDDDIPDINTNARGCVTPGAALGSIGLVIVLSVLLFVVFDQGREEDTGVILLFFCITVVPILVLLVALYVSARAREDRRLADEDDRAAEQARS